MSKIRKFDRGDDVWWASPLMLGGHHAVPAVVLDGDEDTYVIDVEGSGRPRIVQGATLLPRTVDDE